MKQKAQVPEAIFLIAAARPGMLITAPDFFLNSSEPGTRKQHKTAIFAIPRPRQAITFADADGATKEMIFDLTR